MNNQSGIESLKETEKHQQDLENYLGLDVEFDGKEIIHLNHRFFKTFFPTEQDQFADDISFNEHGNFDCWKLLGHSLVEL